MTKLKTIFGVFILALLVGCAHPISIAPDALVLGTLATAEKKIPKKVGFYISPEALSLEVTTAGGGGDNVRYFPYRDMEAGYRSMLSGVFEGVVRVSKLNDSAEFQRGGLAYILSPEMITGSGSTGFLSWPPTNFTVDLTSKVQDNTGKTVGSPRVVGVGTHTEGLLAMNGKHGISGERAMKDALEKMRAALLELFRTQNSIGTGDTSSAAVDKASTGSVESRLQRLKDLFDKKLIGEVEYEKKRSEILSGL